MHFFGSDVSKVAECNSPLGSEGDWLWDTDAKIQRSLNPLYKWSSSVGSSYLWVSHPRIQPAMVCVVLQYVFVGKINLRYRWILAVQTHVVQGSTVH